MDKEQVRQYWKKLYQRSRDETLANLDIKAERVKLIIQLIAFGFILGIAFAFSFLGIKGYQSFYDAVFALVAGTVITAIVIFTGLVFGARLIARGNVLRTAAIIHKEQENEIEAKNAEIQKLQEEFSKSVEQLALWVDHGGHIYPNQGPDEFVMCLAVNVINGETQKILDLEAHLASIDWLTEKGSNVWHHLPFVRKNRLEWEDGSYQVELKPGINELKQLKIAILNCTTREFRFAHEDLPRKFPYHQGNATYSIRIRFSGKSEGNANYKSYEYETEFICVPEESKLEFLQKAENNQDPAT